MGQSNTKDTCSHISTSIEGIEVKYLSVEHIKQSLNSPLSDDIESRQIKLFTLFTSIIYLLETMIDELLRRQKKLTSKKVRKNINELLDFIRILFTEMEFNPNYRIQTLQSRWITRPQKKTIKAVKHNFFNEFLYEYYNYTPFEIFIKNGLNLSWYSKFSPIESVLDISLQIVEIFMNAGADINSSNQKKYTFSNPLYLALDNEMVYNYKVLNLFLQNPSLNVNMCDIQLNSPVIASLFYEEFYQFEFNKIQNISQFDFTKKDYSGLTMLEYLISNYHYNKYSLRKFNRYKENIKQLISHYKDYPHIIEKCLLQISKIEKEEFKYFETKNQSEYLDNTFETFEIHYSNTSIFPIIKKLLEHEKFVKHLRFTTIGGDELLYMDIDYTKHYKLNELKKILSKNNEICSVPFNIINSITGVKIPETEQLFILKPQTYVVVFI